MSKNHAQIIGNCLKYMMNKITSEILYGKDTINPSIREGYDQIMDQVMNGMDCTKLTKNELRLYGFSSWDSEGPMLIPQYLHDSVVPFEAVSINGEKHWFDPSTETDKESRFGCLAYGVIPADMMRLAKPVFATSSKKKQDEFKLIESNSTFIDMDVREVMGNPDEVIMHKVLAVPEGAIVEDSIVVIDGKPIVDWKYTFKDHYVPGKEFTWELRLAVVENGVIHTVTCSRDLVFVDGPVDSPDFDPYANLRSNPLFRTIKDYKDCDDNKSWMDDSHCPRQEALQLLRGEQFTYSIPVHVVQPWTGEYQQ